MTIASRSTERAVEVRLRFSRREMLVWIAATLAAHMLFQRLDFSSVGAFFAQLAGFNTIVCLAWFVVAKLLLASRADEAADAWDYMFAASIYLTSCLASLLTTSITTSAIATATALNIGFRYGRDADLRAAAAIIGALSINALWGPVFFSFFALELLRADAALVGAVFALTRPDVIWLDTTIGVPGGHTIVVMAGCSSFHNISLALLAWVSLTMLQRRSWVRYDLLVAMAAVAATVSINAVRLYLMAWSRDGYAYWHNGTGAEIYSAAAILSILVIGFEGARRTGRAA
jgi:hypothetical protein